MKDHVALKIWKSNAGWNARVYVLASTIGNSTKKKAMKALDELVREMVGCNEACRYPSVWEKKK